MALATKPQIPADLIPAFAAWYAAGHSLSRIERDTGYSRQRLRAHLMKTGGMRQRLSYQGNPETRYLSKVEKQENGCWISSHGINNHGYSICSVHGRPVLMHRYFYEMRNGPIPQGMDACHSCDTPACVNPDHIFIGSRADNMKDAKQKGRLRAGQDSPQAKLTDEQVQWARRAYSDGKTTGEIARNLGVTYKNIWAIVTNRAWKHL